MIDFTALRSIAAAATPGEWPANVWIETDGNEWRATGPGHEDHASDDGAEPGSPDEQQAQADAAHIAAFAPSRALALLDELDRLRAALGEALDIAQAQGCLHPDESDRVDALRAVQRGEK